jgi:xylulokinase
MDYFIGIDVSTTATKALLIDSTGEVLAVASTQYTFETPRPLWSEQHPHLWWDGAQKSIRAVLEKSGVDSTQIGGIGLTGQMHGLVLLDAADEVLRPAILWNDQRTQTQCNEIHQRIGREKFIQITGNVALTGFTAPKILWVKENEPDIYAKAAHVLLPKDYVRYKLTGEFAMDKADGAGTVLLNLKARDWSDEVLSALDIPRAWMPPLYEGPQITGKLTPEAESRDARHGRRRRSGRTGRWCWRGNAGRYSADRWHFGRGVCHNTLGADRAGRAPTRVLSRRAGHVAFHGCDAQCGGQPPVVPRHARAGHEF